MLDPVPETTSNGEFPGSSAAQVVLAALLCFHGSKSKWLITVVSALIMNLPSYHTALE